MSYILSSNLRLPNGNVNFNTGLSDEALGNCFLAAVQPIDLACLSHGRGRLCAPDYHVLKAITEVGKRFRQIAISHSQLWAYLSDSYTNGWNRLLIQRSREHNLVVDISSAAIQQMHGRSRLDSLLHAVAAEMHRVLYLRIQDRGDFITRHRVLGVRAPSLQLFICGGFEETPLSSFPTHLFDGHSPQLVTLDLYHIALFPSQSSPATQNLSFLSLSNIPINSWPSCSELLALLSNCQQVTNLQLRSAGPRNLEGSINTDTLLASPVNLPALEEFVMIYNAKIGTLQAVQVFLNQITAARLTSFTISCLLTRNMVTNFTMIPRSLCPVRNASHLCLSYPASHSLRFRITASSTFNGRMPQEERQFRLSIFNLKPQQDTALGHLLLSAVDKWDLTSVTKISILFRSRQSSPCQPGAEMCTHSPHPRQLLERFPNLYALRLIGSCRETDLQTTSCFIEARLCMDSEKDPPGSRIPLSFVHLQLDHVLLMNNQKILLGSLKDGRNRAGFQLCYWENGRKAEW